MALTKQIEMVSNFGDTVVFNNAYFKITLINGDKNNIDIYVSCSKEKDGLHIKMNSYSFTPNLGGDNFIKQGYEYLKSLPEYADAVDC